MGRRKDLCPLAPRSRLKRGSEIDKLAQADWKMWRTHQSINLIMTSRWNDWLFQKVSSFNRFPPARGKNNNRVLLSGLSFCLSLAPSEGIEAESKQSGSDSISYLNAHIVCVKSVISLFSLLSTKLTLPGAHHRWRYKVLSFRRDCLEGWESIIYMNFAQIFIVVNSEETSLFQKKTRPQCLKLCWMLDSLPRHTIHRLDERWDQIEIFVHSRAAVLFPAWLSLLCRFPLRPRAAAAALPECHTSDERLCEIWQPRFGL